MLSYQNGIPIGTAEEIREKFLICKWNLEFAEARVSILREIVDHWRIKDCAGDFYRLTNIIKANSGIAPQYNYEPQKNGKDAWNSADKFGKKAWYLTFFKKKYLNGNWPNPEFVTNRSRWLDFLLYCRVWTFKNGTTAQKRLDLINKCLSSVGHSILYPLHVQDYCAMVTIVFDLSYSQYIDLETSVTELLSVHPEANKWETAKFQQTTPIFRKAFRVCFIDKAEEQLSFDDILKMVRDYVTQFAADFGRAHVTAFLALSSFFLYRNSFDFLDRKSNNVAISKRVTYLKQKISIQQIIDVESFKTIIRQNSLKSRIYDYNCLFQEENTVIECFKDGIDIFDTVGKILNDGIDIFDIHEFSDDVNDYLRVVQKQTENSISEILNNKNDARRRAWNVDCKKFIFCPSIESGPGAEKQYEYLEKEEIAQARKRSGVFKFLPDEYIDGNQVFYKKDISRDTILLAIIYTTTQYEIDSPSAKSTFQKNIDIMLDRLGLAQLNPQNNKIDFLLLSSLYNCQYDSIKRPLLNYIVNELKLDEKELIYEQEF